MWAFSLRALTFHSFWETIGLHPWYFRSFSRSGRSAEKHELISISDALSHSWTPPADWVYPSRSYCAQTTDHGARSSGKDGENPIWHLSGSHCTAQQPTDRYSWKQEVRGVHIMCARSGASSCSTYEDVLTLQAWLSFPYVSSSYVIY